jgi:tetratricopeptide (TPR) repeat protein
MSHTPTISQPPEPLTGTTARGTLPPNAEPSGSFDQTIRRLQQELAATADRTRQSRLLAQIADLHERSGDEPAAARDFLAAFNADPAFREPLEGLVRLLEKRRSLKNLGKLVGALVRAALTPDEKVRALLMRAAYQADVSGEVAEAKASVLEAAEIEGAPSPERASTWLALEVLAGRTGDPATRLESLGHRIEHSPQPTWRALLLLDRAHLIEASGEVDAALALLEQARALESQATWMAATMLEHVAHEHAGTPGTEEARARAEVRAHAIEASASLVEQAITDPARGDALGVPMWARTPARMVEAWLRLAELRRSFGQADRAADVLDRALVHVQQWPDSEETQTAEAAVASARVRIAELTGDTALAARLAEKRLATEKNGPLAAALAMRIAEHAASRGDGPKALEALSRAIGSDPGCLPARALQLDLLADGGDSSAFASQLEAFADHLATDEARGRAFLLAAYVWAIRANDVAGAKAALSQAAMFGFAPATTARLARALASVVGDAPWYEEATKRLIAAGANEAEALSLYVELVRSRYGRGDTEGAAKALREMGGSPRGAWLARVLEAFLPPPEMGPDEDPEQTVSKAGGRARGALEELATLEPDPSLARGLALVAALRAHAAGDGAGARKQLRALADKDASDVLVASVLADFERAAGDHGGAARIAGDAAMAATDPGLAAALHIEAAFERWREGDPKACIEELEAAAQEAPEAAKLALAWASRGVEQESIEGRRRAIERAAAGGAADPRVLALERFAIEVAGGDPQAAEEALASIDRTPDGAVGVAAALGRLVWSRGAADADAMREALVRIASRGPRALSLATAEQVRMARDANDAEGLAHAAARWFEAGGGLPAALEWLVAATMLGRPADEKQARLAMASALTGEAREALLASAAWLETRVAPDAPAPLPVGESPAVRLVSLELAPPGSDPRRRGAVLGELGSVLGDDAAVDATGLAGWSFLAASDMDGARAAFEKTVAARPGDLAAWEGLRACGERTGDKALQARAAAELGARCQDATRGGSFWEEAALLWLDLGDGANAERGLEEAFARDPKRGVAFDKLFRRVRDRKDNDRLLELTTRRLEVADDPREIEKLYWEQARSLREKGDQDGALNALEHVTMLDPDHVGALALLGEINIKRANFEPAAEALARLAQLDVAPAKNRVTAGVAAVDLYENKLSRFDKALEVLLALHRAKLSTLPVRERLARAAARTGSWKEATDILEELMFERPEVEGRVEAARLAIAIHRDRLNDAQGAAAAIVKLLEESPTDGEAIDALLQTEHPSAVRERLLKGARAGLVDIVHVRPTDVANVRRLVKVARALGDDAIQQAGLGTLLSLGAADAQAEQAFAQLAARKGRTPQIAVSEAMLRAMLAPGDQGPVADLFVLLGPTLAEALGPSLQACGVSRRDRVDPRSGLALRNEIATWAGAFGVREFELYVGGKDPLGVQGIPGEPPSLVVGSGVNAPLSPVTRARVAREVLGVVRGTTVTRSRDDVTVAAIAVACCRIAEVPIQHPPYAVLVEVERLVSKALPRRTRKSLSEICQAIVRTNADARAWSRRAVASQDRVATIASGDPSVVLSDVLGASVERLGQSVKGNPRAEELLRFVLSSPYLEIRRALGLEGSP